MSGDNSQGTGQDGGQGASQGGQDGGQGQNTGQGQGTPQGQPQGGQDGGQGQAGKPEPDWKAEARKWEQRAKTNSAAAKELEQIKAAQQTAEERAQAAARAAEARAANALRQIASAEIRAALTGIVPDPATVVEDLNLDRFLDTESGEVNANAVEALRAKYQQLAPPPGPRAPAPNPAQGSGGTPPPTLAQLIAEAESKTDRTPAETRALLRLKARQALNPTQG